MIHFGHVSQRINLGYFASCEPTCQPVTDLDSRPVEVFRTDPEPCKFDGAVEPEEALKGDARILSNSAMFPRNVIGTRVVIGANSEKYVPKICKLGTLCPKGCTHV